MDLAALDTRVAERVARFDNAQAEFNRARDELTSELYSAFRRMCPCNAGDRISILYDFGGRLRRVEGRAVFHRNGTKFGLYLDAGHGERIPIPEPYADNVRLVYENRRR